MAAEEMSNMAQQANSLAFDLERVIYKKQIDALIETMERFHVPSRCYSLFEERDESSCLVYDKGIWFVYYSERNLKTNSKQTEDLEEACRFLLYAMAENEEEYHQMVHYYDNELKNQSPGKFSSSDFYKTIMDALKRMAATAAM